MNIILNRKLHLIIFILLNTLHLYSNEHQNNDFRLNTEVGLGYSTGIELHKNEGNLKGITSYLRFMWKPQHRLNIGLEFDYLKIREIEKKDVSTEFGSTDFNSTLSAIPILLVFNMEFNDLQVYSGIGVSYMWSEATAYNQKIVNDNINYSLMISGKYIIKKFNENNLSLEVKSNIITKLDLMLINFNINYEFNLYKW